MNKSRFYPEVREYVENCIQRFDTIPNDRKATLSEVASYIKQSDEAQLVFICTHNSRRSHFGQIWAAVAAQYYGFDNVSTYSGGTEATVFHYNAVSAVKRAGIEVTNSKEENPRYELRFAEGVSPLICFSKEYDDPFNPSQHFAAIMTCSDADENCPIVHGAEFRARVTYEDPKVADGSLKEAETYSERCQQIATEMLYMFSLA